MQFISTRSRDIVASPAQAIAQGLAQDGGLFVPDSLPVVDSSFWKNHTGRYSDMAAKVMSLFFTDMDDLPGLCATVYHTNAFSSSKIAPVVMESDGELTLELFHGPTAAFKDMALQILPGLMSRANALLGDDKKTCILTATSGDTGKAALEGFANHPNTFVIVYYPDEGVSPIQRQQMVSQQGNNVGVCAVKGNFDDAQTAVKKMFANPDFVQAMADRGYRLSSANSINIGRLVPQIAYYFHAYAELVNQGTVFTDEKLNFCVPTGNFGNILAGLYAKQMGLPIDRLICASNRNRVLTDVLTTGRYSLSRDFYVTTSPSMDILVSSNFERALHLLSGGDSEMVKALMQQLLSKGAFGMTIDLMNEVSKNFAAYSCDDAETLTEIVKSYQETGKVFDPHTAVARKCLREHRMIIGNKTKTVVLATASPYKFPETMLKAFHLSESDSLSSMRTLARHTKTEVPAGLSAVLEHPVRFTQVAEPDKLSEAALDFVGN